MEDQPHIDYIHLNSTIDQTKKDNRNPLRRNSCSALEKFITNRNNAVNPVIKPIFVKSEQNDHLPKGDISLLLRNASLSSDYPPEVCQTILNEFEQIKNRNL